MGTCILGYSTLYATEYSVPLHYTRHHFNLSVSHEIWGGVNIKHKTCISVCTSGLRETRLIPSPRIPIHGTSDWRSTSGAGVLKMKHPGTT